MPYRSRLGRTAAIDRTSVIPAALLLAAAIGFGASRDLGAFLLGLVVMPALALLTVAWIGVALLAGGARGTRVGIATAVALAALPGYLLAGAARDPVRFVGWELAHAPVDRLTRRDAVLAWWDSWGMAGMENDSYLVADPADAIGRLDRAQAWRRRLHLGCEVVATRRMAARLYLLTTYNCPFDAGRRWS